MEHMFTVPVSVSLPPHCVPGKRGKVGGIRAVVLGRGLCTAHCFFKEVLLSKRKLHKLLSELKNFDKDLPIVIFSTVELTSRGCRYLRKKIILNLVENVTKSY